MLLIAVIKKKAMSMSKQKILMKNTIIVIARILKVLAIILLITMLVTKMILKTSIVKIWNSVVITTLQIRQILI